MSVANEENAVKMSDYDEGFRAGMQIVLYLANKRIEDLEAKLAKAMQALELALDFADNDLVDFDKYGLSCDADINERYRTTIAELKGQKDGWKCPINHPNCEENCGNYGCGN